MELRAVKLTLIGHTDAKLPIVRLKLGPPPDPPDCQRSGAKRTTTTLAGKQARQKVQKVEPQYKMDTGNYKCLGGCRKPHTFRREGYSNWSNWRMHMATQHGWPKMGQLVYPADNPLGCWYCAKGFIKKSDLVKHLNSSSHPTIIVDLEEKPDRWEACGDEEPWMMMLVNGINYPLTSSCDDNGPNEKEERQERWRICGLNLKQVKPAYGTAYGDVHYQIVSAVIDDLMVAVEAQYEASD